ncbi:MAG: S-methyl-5-thioribose-1-phosphate isomerase [Candidatus Omnitrophica bacterium]|nr:S-methyl-5-thioribose-1-phosphate isomerase [Candidatus Omnitrophota bacterium]
MGFKTIIYRDNKLKIIDQRQLPGRLILKHCNNIKDIYNSIKTLTVRGAPAIGVFAAYGVCVGLRTTKTPDREKFFKALSKIISYLKKSRPTAVNLFWALDRMEGVAYKNKDKPTKEIKGILLKEAKQINREDEIMCKRIGINGAKLIRSGDNILTHCNAGALATSGEGTALSVIYAAKKRGKRVRVYADETRPLLQGARLSAWELKQKGIDVTLICDNVAATLMKQGKIDKIIVGADRIAANGDAANKIGTYGVAVLAKEHKVPFYIAAPSSTFDFSLKNGRDIPIEERDPDEVKSFGGLDTAPKNIKVYNPAFDVTPSNFISAIITEKGILTKPYSKSLKSLK